MPASPPPFIAQILHGAKSLGSGIVIGPTLILTCAHVVRSVTPKTNLTLEIAGKPFRGKVLFRDNAEQVDLAVIQLTRALEQSAIAWCAAIRENDQCEAIGFPAGIFESMRTSAHSETSRQVLIKLELPEGASGGALVKLVDGHPHCVGVLRQRHEPGISRVIAMAAVQAFLDKHGISLPTLPPPTLNRKYDTARYLESLRKETCEIDLDAFNVARERPPAMDALYIPLKTPAAATKKTSTIERHPVTLESALVHRLLIVEGEAGSGKTTFLRRIAWALCRPDKETRLKLPFSGFAMFIRVSDLDRHIEQTLRNPRPGDPTLGHHARWIPHYLASRGWGLDEAFFAHQLALADSILLLDGLDEAADAPRRERISKLVKEACARGCRYVISMRPRADEGRARLDGFFKCHVEPLDLAGIQLFLRAWCEWRGKDSAYNEGLLHDVNHTPRDLRTNPLMLTALAVVYLKDKHLPEQRAALYEAIVTWLAAQARQRWGDPISETDLLRRLSALALAMQQWKGGQALALPVQSAAEAIAHTFDAAAPLEAVVAFLERAQLVSGIVTLRGNNEVAFWHRTFREYLAARALSAMREKDRERIARKFLHSAEGREVLPLLAGRMEESGHDLVHDLFAALLSETEGKSLKENAHAAGVIGKMLSDLKRTAYALPKEPASAWEALLKDVMAIFDP